MQPNMEKYDKYRYMKADLKKAMAAGFYYQAIFIEYAIMEDRCLSALEHAGVEYQNKNGKIIGISTKLNRMENRPEFGDKTSKRYFTKDFIESLRTWIENRDRYIHKLAREPFSPEHLKEVAEEGKVLQERLSYCVRKVNDYHDAQTKSSAKEKP